MSIETIRNAQRMQAMRATSDTYGVRAAIVTSYDPSRYAAKVQYQLDGALSGWLPVAAHWVGNGWGMFSPPSPGDQVNVEFVDGDIGAGTVTARIWDDNNQPLPVPAGEWWVVHKLGQKAQFKNDGSIVIDDAHGASVTLDGAGNINSTGAWKHTGTLHVTDNVQVDKTLTANTDVIAGNISLKGHHTAGVQPGGGTSGLPTP